MSTLLARFGFVRTLRLRPIVTAAIGAGVVCLVLLLSWKNYEEYMRVRELGGFAASVVREQADSLAQASRARGLELGSPRGSGVWREESPELARWLIDRMITTSNPGQTLAALRRGLRGARVSPAMQASTDRWIEALSRWAGDSKSVGLPEGLDDSLRQARSRYFEAIGYEQIGRGYDAIALYLWVIDLLVPFTQKALSHPQLPEALFLLGASYFHLRSRLPEGIRGDRILNLCLEVFPETVWANQAGLLWRNWMIPHGGHGKAEAFPSEERAGGGSTVRSEAALRFAGDPSVR